jgi:hypothetical protein
LAISCSLLKARVGEWDASGFNNPEQFNHQEYTIVRILKHPQFSAGRLSNDIALLYTDRDIDLSNPYVNTACLPACDNMFALSRQDQPTQRGSRTVAVDLLDELWITYLERMALRRRRI